MSVGVLSDQISSIWHGCSNSFSGMSQCIIWVLCSVVFDFRDSLVCFVDCFMSLHSIRTLIIWAATWQNQHNECAPSEDSDQPGHPPSLIRVFAVRSKGSYGPKVYSCEQRRLWSDWADAQADRGLRWANTHFVGFVMSRLTYLWQYFSLVCFTAFSQ